MQIIWNRNIEAKNKKEIEKYLTPFLWLVPAWCQELHVALYPVSEDNENNAVATLADYEYRRIKIDFYAGWLNERDEAKQMHVIHELVHGATLIAIDYALYQFGLICPEDEQEKFNHSICRELRARNEAATQDLAFAIYQKFVGSK